MPEAWSVAEVEATVADYLAMLRKEIAGIPCNKSEHRRALAALLRSRSNSAIERKHMNISAVLLELGVRTIEGYQPLGNYQELLREVVAERVAGDRALLADLAAEIEAPVAIPAIEDILSALEDPPEPSDPRAYPKGRPMPERRASLPVDYLALEARNQALGDAGEEFVMRFEAARLARAGKAALADRIERVSRTQGAWVGFDIRSYEPDGSDRFLEVKTTRYIKETPFFVTRNEVAVSLKEPERYHLCRVFRFRSDRMPGLFSLQGSLETTCRLDPVSFVARVG
ncbi:MAG: DUF3883 domain-containing protein [Gemmatimonadota bacterium]|nr:DUF3883 domain-containing protein [Gemmatimonadota bacterium]